MLADLCPNVLFDTSSSNGWIKYLPGLTLEAVFKQALAVLGPDRLLFGSDSSFFPRGWVRDVHAQQSSALDTLGVSGDVKARSSVATSIRVFRNLDFKTLPARIRRFVFGRQGCSTATLWNMIRRWSFLPTIEPIGSGRDQQRNMRRKTCDDN